MAAKVIEVAARAKVGRKLRAIWCNMALYSTSPIRERSSQIRSSEALRACLECGSGVPRPKAKAGDGASEDR